MGGVTLTGEYFQTDYGAASPVTTSSTTTVLSLLSSVVTDEYVSTKVVMEFALPITTAPSDETLLFSTDSVYQQDDGMGGRKTAYRHQNGVMYNGSGTVNWTDAAIMEIDVAVLNAVFAGFHAIVEYGFSDQPESGY